MTERRARQAGGVDRPAGGPRSGGRLASRRAGRRSRDKVRHRRGGPRKLGPKVLAQQGGNRGGDLGLVHGRGVAPLAEGRGVANTVARSCSRVGWFLFTTMT